MAPKKKSASLEGEQEKPKSAAKSKKTTSRTKKSVGKSSTVNDEGFDSDYQPVVYGEKDVHAAVSAGKDSSGSSAMPTTGKGGMDSVGSSSSASLGSAMPAPSSMPASSSPAASGSSGSGMGSSSAMSQFAPLSASALHKSPMSAPNGSMPNTPAMGSKLSPADDGEILRDIKPREKMSKDAAFLAPEKFGFDLKKNAVGAQASKGRWVNILIYSLSTLIIALTILLFVLTFYSGKLVKDQNSTDLSGADQSQSQTTSTSGSTTGTSTAASGQTVGSTYQFTITNLPADLQSALVALVQGQFKDNSVTVSNANSNLQLPTVTDDTIFVKTPNQPQTTALMNALAQYGIKPQIQTKSDLPVDASLDFVTILPKPDLSGLTSTVYNATGTSGLAKKYCNILTGYKVSNCQSLNATANQTGTTISYKNPKALFTLRRTNEFSGAKFSQADSSQIEDIKVTLGK